MNPEAQQMILSSILADMVSICNEISKRLEFAGRLNNTRFVEGVGRVVWTHIGDDVQITAMQQATEETPVGLEVACTLERTHAHWQLSDNERSFVINAPGEPTEQHAFVDVSREANGHLNLTAPYDKTLTDEQLQDARTFMDRLITGFQAHETAI
ncbi:hypothetical protein KDA23_03700 [Candidatus Saccharibacteria bacterium]|nr:hypothetical protein [Candidatus Saccharibacteria bacterium]